MRLSPLTLAWVSSAFAAATLSLGVSGTLSSWTSAVLTNPTNTVTTAGAVILQEAQGTTTCLSSASASNVSTCATINKYGGTANALYPGGSQTVDVTFTNVGSVAASSFKLTPGTCSSTPSTGTPTPNNLCGTDLTVSVGCSNGTTYSAAAKWADLTYAAGSPGSLPTLTHTASLAANASWTCEFVVALPAAASVLDQGVTVSQPLTWTLTK